MFGLSRLSPIQLIVLLVIGVLAFGAPLLQLTSNPMRFLAVVLGLLVGITVHEASHATVALALGDPTPHRMGRVSLNPLRHLDPLGTIFMFIAGFGWGKPVMFDPRHLRIDPRLGSALVSVAGPISNIFVALLVLIVRENVAISPRDPAYIMLTGIITLNVALAAFNLLPIPPLDGFGFVINLLPRPIAVAIEPVAVYGPIILLAVILLGPYVFHTDVLGFLMHPILNAIETFIVSAARLVT